MKLVVITLMAMALTFAIVHEASAEFRAPSSGYWTYCGGRVWAWHGLTHYTSCPFALNVARGVRRSPDWGMNFLVGTSYSPVTHKTYTVKCRRVVFTTYRCTAGIGAIVWVAGLWVPG
jgi:hypothetical protein